MDEDGNTPLLVAVQEGHLWLVQLLLETEEGRNSGN